MRGRDINVSDLRLPIYEVNVSREDWRRYIRIRVNAWRRKERNKEEIPSIIRYINV